MSGSHVVRLPANTLKRASLHRQRLSLTPQSSPPGGTEAVFAPAIATPVHHYRLQLFVAGDTPNCAQALANVTALCRAHLLDCHDLEVIDVFRHPERALAEGIFVAPTLVKQAPGDLLKIVGTLSDTSAVLRALGLPQP